MTPDTDPSLLAAARTLLFVPADRPERIAKALASAADMVIVDLEDAVAPDAKSAARAALVGHVGSEPRVALRINGAETPWIADDLAFCRDAGVRTVMVPKAAAGDILEAVAAEFATMALIESAIGLLGATEVATTPGVERLALGTIDLALDMDLDVPDEALASVRLHLTAASRAAGLPGPIDGVTKNFADPDAVRVSMLRARSLGFTGKLCIHPAQIAPAMAALRPSAGTVAHAKRIVEADRASEGAAVALDGQMVDRPLVERARLLLYRAGE